MLCAPFLLSPPAPLSSMEKGGDFENESDEGLCPLITFVFGYIPGVGGFMHNTAEE